MKLLAVSVLGIFSLLLLSNCTKEQRTTGALDDIDSKVSGKVLDADGNPLTGVNVTTSDNLGIGLTNGNGEYSVIFEVSETTPKTIYFNRYGFVDTTLNVQVEFNNEKTDQNITLTSSFATITGNVSNGLSKRSASADLSGISVSIPNQQVWTVTDSDGNFTLKNVLPDARIIIATLSGTGWGSSVISLTAGAKLNINISLDKAGSSIAGTVTDEAGQPVGNINVHTLGGGLTTVANGNGQFRLENVPDSVSIDVLAGEVGKETYSAGGLIVDKNSQLDGISVKEQITGGNSDIFIRDRDMYVPEEGSITIVADVGMKDKDSNLVDHISFFIWDIDGDGIYEDTTYTPTLVYTGTETPKEINYGIMTADSTLIKGAVITINRVSANPDATIIRAVVGQDIEINPNNEANLLGEGLCQTGGIVSYLWDFNGDGNYDWLRKDAGKVMYRYYRAGEFDAVFKVIAANGKSDSAIIKVSVAGPPADIPEGVAIPTEINNIESGKLYKHNLLLEWYKADVDSYSVYMGKTSPPDSLIKSGLSATDTSLLVEGLDDDVKYFFQIETHKDTNKAVGFVQDVLIGDNMPPVLIDSLFMPDSGATVSGDSILLQWGATDEDGDELNYTLYFSMGNPPGKPLPGLTTNTLKVAPGIDWIESDWIDGGLYYWQVEIYDRTDTILSGVFEFIYKP
ncbi:MAG: hypothetical protein HQK83_08990 [Fibrobacteria bacterium]|nr:hypothetical protein [Fibrobacteria bacterium]